MPAATLKKPVSEWKVLDDVDHWVREAASLYATVPGASEEYVAAYMNRPIATVKQAFASRPVQEYIRKLEFKVMQKRAELTEDLTEIRETSISRIKECLSEASLKDAIAAGKWASEVHPDRHLVKMEKREEKHTHNHHVTGNLIDELKQRHLAAVKPVIQVEAEVIEPDDDNQQPEETEE